MRKKLFVTFRFENEDMEVRKSVFVGNYGYRHFRRQNLS